MRILSTCKDKGIEAVTIYTSPEKNLPHALFSDEAYCLGEGPLSETYLNQDKLIEICHQAKVDAVHPGYGFLSENASFAKRLAGEGIIFIGPTPHAIEVMGDKIGSKKWLSQTKVPMIPGYHGDDQSAETLFLEAKKIGLPVLIKASAGGGGKGMRIVEREGDFISALEAAQREAQNAFGNPQVLIEKFVQNPRHIEVQVLSDTHGQHFHLYERECSIQRRYQKIIEEAPSPSLSPEEREAITRAAVEITSTLNYVGAGTVEFIFDDSTRDFYFLEMNTRLQVEHPVTEMVTGLDLVALQIKVAEGEKLKLTQKEIPLKGHAIEGRIYAERPAENFLPSTGKVERLFHGPFYPRGTRIDCGLLPGNTVGIDFDPMLAKVMAWGEDRRESINRLDQLLSQASFWGVETNITYLKAILALDEFERGETCTHFVKTHEEKLMKAISTPKFRPEALAAYLFSKKLKKEDKEMAVENTNVWSETGPFKNI